MALDTAGQVEAEEAHGQKRDAAPTAASATQRISISLQLHLQLVCLPGQDLDFRHLGCSQLVTNIYSELLLGEPPPSWPRSCTLA